MNRRVSPPAEGPAPTSPRNYETKSVTQQREHSLELQVPQLVAPPAEPPRHAAQVQRVERGHLIGRKLKGDRNIGSDA